MVISMTWRYGTDTNHESSQCSAHLHECQLSVGEKQWVIASNHFSPNWQWGISRESLKRNLLEKISWRKSLQERDQSKCGLTNDDRHVTIFFGFELLWLVKVDDDCDHEQQKQQLKHNLPAFAGHRIVQQSINLSNKLRHSERTKTRQVLNAFQYARWVRGDRSERSSER